MTGKAVGCSVLVLGILALAVLFGWSAAEKDGPAFAGAWREPTSEELRAISRALVKAGATGCGAFDVDPSTKAPHELAVRCSPDGQSPYTYWIVWTRIEKADGPFARM